MTEAEKEREKQEEGSKRKGARGRGQDLSVTSQTVLTGSILAINHLTAIENEVVAQAEDGQANNVSPLLGQEPKDNLRGNKVIEYVFVMSHPGQGNVLWVQNLVGGYTQDLFGIIAEDIGDGGRCPEEAALGGEVMEGDVAVDLEHGVFCERQPVGSLLPKV